MADKYNHTLVEKKWQGRWQKEHIYQADINAKRKFYNLWMFPYPSAEGLHAGHAFASTGSDIYGRFMRMSDKEVFQPIGYDSFGIHSENYAIKIGETPQKMLARTTKHYEKQLRSLGHGYDWTKTVTTSDPDYYKWTQWLFIEMFKSGLAYKKKASVNFCPSCKTVLADEQVVSPVQAGREVRMADGTLMDPSLSGYDEARVCERCGTVVEKKELDQWFFRITDYAERLLRGLTKIDWSSRVVVAQREWIGKKEGVIIRHRVKGSDIVLEAFSAYPAWLFADTFLVMAPEHPLVLELVKGTKYEKEVMDFIAETGKVVSNEEKTKKEKNGVFIGRYVIDGLTGREFPVWLANFALMDFGTGIIRCSAHDIRDYEFATKYKIPLKEVVERIDPKLPINAHGNTGVLKDSGPFSGKHISPKLIEKILNWIIKEKIGERNTTYHLRDWLVSRQRYWGAPIPMIHCKNCEQKAEGYLTLQGETLQGVFHQDHSDWSWHGWWPEEDLPVKLPKIDNYRPEGMGHGPLAHHPEFYEVKCPNCGSKAQRETDVMDTFVDSSWYFLRYPSVGSDVSSRSSGAASASLDGSRRLLPWDPEITRRWLPPDLYFGGAEHSVLHLMYARFVTMALSDLGYLNFEEPFPRFFAHGLMIKDGAKMSKSRGNVVNPDEYVAKYGADSLRLYVMFMGPMDGYPDFRDTGIEGMSRFVQRVWKLYTDYKDFILEDQNDSQEVLTKLHQTIKKVTNDISSFKYNTAIASLMEFVNVLYDKISAVSSRSSGAESASADASTRQSNIRCAEWEESLKDLCLMLAPFAPHLAEEIWVELLGHSFSVHNSHWPKYVPDLVKTGEVTVVVQINGKVRGTISLSSESAQEESQVTRLAKQDEKISKWLKGTIAKTIFVPGKVINFII